MDNEEMKSFRVSVRSRLLIDGYQLIEECKKQPAFYEEVSSELAEIKHAAKKAKAVVEFTKAELERAIRKDPEKFDMVKTTETAIIAAVTIQDEYQDALTKQRDAERLVDSVQACVFAVEQRKSMIRDLVSLFTYNYVNSDANVVQGQLSDSSEDRVEAIQNTRRATRESVDNDK
jgi:hypothetical protein